MLQNLCQSFKDASWFNLYDKKKFLEICSRFFVLILPLDAKAIKRLQNDGQVAQGRTFKKKVRFER